MASRIAVMVVVAALGLAGCGSSPRPAAPWVTGAPSPSVPTSSSAPAGASSTTAATVAPPGFVLLGDVDPGIVQDIRYASAHNFVGRRIDGYVDPVCILTDEAARALRRVQAAAVERGLSLKVYDCYRPARAGADFVAWRDDPDAPGLKAEFFPSLTKAQLFRQGFVGGAATSHSSGSTVDLTLVRRPPAPQRSYVEGEPLVACTAADRFPDTSVDMGTGFDCFDPRSHTLDAQVTGAAHDNRLLLRDLMAAEGFVNYRNEWWHFDREDDPFHGQFFDFPNARAAVG